MSASTAVRQEDLTVRPAMRADCAAMLSLIKELAVYEKEPEAVTVTLEEMEECGFGSRPLWGAFVAEWASEHGPQVVGMALYYYRYSTWRGKMLYLEDFVVSSQYRGGGIGHALFDRVLAHAQEDRCHGMVWQVLEWNAPAIHFYEKYKANFDGAWVNCTVSFDKKTPEGGSK